MAPANGRQRDSGTAGEYFVAAELSMRGWLATVTIKDAPGIDVLVTDPARGRTAAIQGKTTSKANGRFVLKPKDEVPPAPWANEWYVFVALKEIGARADFYVVPRAVVADAVYSDHQEWLLKPDAKGRTRKPSSTRDMQAVHLAGYREAWHLLDRPACDAPYLGPRWWVDRAAAWPREGGYPGLGLVDPDDEPADRIVRYPADMTAMVQAELDDPSPPRLKLISD
jgi:hypothetical protein